MQAQLLCNFICKSDGLCYNIYIIYISMDEDVYSYLKQKKEAKQSSQTIRSDSMEIKNDEIQAHGSKEIIEKNKLWQLDFFRDLSFYSERSLSMKESERVSVKETMSKD